MTFAQGIAFKKEKLRRNKGRSDVIGETLEIYAEAASPDAASAPQISKLVPR